MFFRPSFCASCGEKIERDEWHFWTSRRFCEVCASQYRGIDLIPKVIISLGMFGVVFGISGYFRGDSNAIEPIAAKRLKVPVDKSTVATSNPGPTEVPRKAEKESAELTNKNAAKPDAAVQGPQIAKVEKVPADGPVYICGAQTRKGMPCSRRVKGYVRCFQHTGMPAMLPPDKLRVG
jgi:hypothetical protein